MILTELAAGIRDTAGEQAALRRKEWKRWKFWHVILVMPAFALAAAAATGAITGVGAEANDPTVAAFAALAAALATAHTAIRPDKRAQHALAKANQLAELNLTARHLVILHSPTMPDTEIAAQVIAMDRELLTLVTDEYQPSTPGEQNI